MENKMGIDKSVVKKQERNIFLYFLIFFSLVILGSILFLLNNVKKKNSVSIFEKIKGEGFYKIEKPESVSPNIPFKVKIIADSDNKDVNAVGLFVSFDPNKLTIMNLDTSQSFCQFYPENKFSNAVGIISIQCGAPNPGFNGESTIAVVTFIAKNVGETFLSISDKSQILLNDGKGTDIFIKPLRESIVILNKI